MPGFPVRFRWQTGIWFELFERQVALLERDIARDITDRKRTTAALRFLADASASLASLVDYGSTLQKVASLAVPSFADWCGVDMPDGDGSV